MLQTPPGSRTENDLVPKAQMLNESLSTWVEVDLVSDIVLPGESLVEVLLLGARKFHRIFEGVLVPRRVMRDFPIEHLARSLVHGFITVGENAVDVEEDGFHVSSPSTSTSIMAKLATSTASAAAAFLS